MPKSKKSTAAVADLPIIETVAKVRKPRASRSKAAIAARVNEAIANKEFEGLSDAKLAKAGIRIVSFFEQSASEVLPVDTAAVLGVEAAQVAEDYSTVSDRSAVMQRLTAIEHGWTPEPVSDHPATLIADAAQVIEDRQVFTNLVFGEPWTAEPAHTHPATDAEIDAAIAALEMDVDADDPEVVRSLADVDLGAMYVGADQPVLTILREITSVLGYAEWGSPLHAEDILVNLIGDYHTPAKTAIERVDAAAAQSGIEEAALARLSSWVLPFGQVVKLPPTDAERSLIDSIPHKFGKLIQTISLADRVADMNDDSALPMIEKEYALDDRTADGSTFAVVGSQAVIDLIDRLLPDVEAALPTIDSLFLPVGEEVYNTLTAQHDKILDLEGQLVDAKAEAQRAEIVAREALRDIGQKKAIIAHRDAKIEKLGIEIEGAQQACNRLAEELAGKSTQVRRLTEEANKMIEESRKAIAERAIARSNRGFWSRLFNRAA